MDLSIIVPAHNESKKIEQTLQTIQNSLKNTVDYEIIVVCDACTDDTYEKAKKYTDKVVQVQNKSRGDTRNDGAKIALGKKLLFVDADTLINKSAVLRALNKLDNKIYSVVGTYWTHDSANWKFFEKVINFYLYVTNTAPGYFLMCRNKQFIPFKAKSDTEDIRFCVDMHKHGETHLLRNSGIITSARRIEKEGVVGISRRYSCFDSMFVPLSAFVLILSIVLLIISIILFCCVCRHK